MGEITEFVPKLRRPRPAQNGPGASRGEVSRFVSRSERERARLVREARAIYDSIFPPADPPGTKQDEVQDGHLTISANASHGDGDLA
jgi:hypothetical protein